MNNIKEKADNALDNNVHFVEYIKECPTEQQPILSNHLCKHQNILDVPQLNSNVTLDSQLKERNQNKAMILTILDNIVRNAMKVSSTVHQDKKTRLNNIKEKADTAPDTNFNFVEYSKTCSKEQQPILSNHLCQYHGTEKNKLVCSIVR